MRTGLALDDPAYFERLEQVEAAHWWSLGLWRLATEWLDAALRGRRGLVALDVGCGAGGSAVRLRDRSEIDSVLALDPSPEALLRAANRGVGSLLLGSAMKIPIGDDRIDVATCLDVLQHLPPGGDRTALAELRRVVRPGGIVLIRGNGRGGWIGDGENTPYDLDALESALVDSGLNVVRSSYANCVPAFAHEIRSWLRTGSRSAGHPSGGGLRIAMPPPWINRSMGLIAQAEAIAAGRLGWRLPFGHSTMLLARK